MKVQIRQQAVRLRIDEAELTRLLAGETLSNDTRWPDGQTRHQQLVLAEHDDWQRDPDGWHVSLAAAVRELARHLPSRDGLHVELPCPDGPPLNIRFDIDVRDSTRQRLSSPSS